MDVLSFCMFLDNHKKMKKQKKERKEEISKEIYIESDK